MSYKNITHNLETLSKEQKSDLEIAETLLENMNSLRDYPGYPKTVLGYDGVQFYPKNAGFKNAYIANDINKAILKDLEKHLDFILKDIQKNFQEYNTGKKKPVDHKNLEYYFSVIFKYYGVDSDLEYPLYKNDKSFIDFIKRLKSKTEEELLKK